MRAAGRIRRALGFVLLVAACARVPPPELRADAAELLSRLRAAQARVQRVRGTARVHVDSPRQSGSVDAFVAAEKPDHIRLEAHDFFGNVVAVLVADGKRFAYYDARERSYFRGEPTPENVSRLLPVVVPADELATILCGSAPVLEGRALEAVPRGDEVLLTVGAGAVGQQLTLGAELAVAASRVRRLSPRPGGGLAEDAPAYDLEFDLFRHRAGGRFPTTVELVAPSAAVRISLEWKADLDVNPPPDPALFRLEPPRGARIVDLEPGASVPGSELPLRGDRE